MFAAFKKIEFLNCFQSNREFLVFHFFKFTIFSCPVGWGCRIQQLHLCRGGRLLPNECPGYDTKQFDDEAPVMLRTPSLPSLPGPLKPGEVALDRVQSIS